MWRKGTYSCSWSSLDPKLERRFKADVFGCAFGTSVADRIVRRFAREMADDLILCRSHICACVRAFLFFSITS